ncbi:MAG: shikimate kinase [Thermoanaerobaculales bacterium]|nr:shikimate kinase [Thermoanaerobaculales bacterium]
MVKLRVMVNIYLVGFMGAGKTSAGQQLAQHLDARFLDLDDRLSEVFGCSISEVFSNHGEAAFRAAETEVLQDLCGAEGLVVSTGGGAFSSESNRRLIDESGGISVFLDLSWEVLENRLANDNDGRPVYENAEQARRLFMERLPHYRRAAVSVALSGDETPAAVAEIVADAVRGVPCGI